MNHTKSFEAVCPPSGVLIPLGPPGRVLRQDPITANQQNRFSSSQIRRQLGNHRSMMLLRQAPVQSILPVEAPTDTRSHAGATSSVVAAFRSAASAQYMYRRRRRPKVIKVEAETPAQTSKTVYRDLSVISRSLICNGGTGSSAFCTSASRESFLQWRQRFGEGQRVPWEQTRRRAKHLGLSQPQNRAHGKSRRW